MTVANTDRPDAITLQGRACGRRFAAERTRAGDRAGRGKRGQETYHKGVVGELVPVEQVLQEVGALVAGVTPGHRRADGAHLEQEALG